MNEAFVALSHRNYRLWFIGQLVSVIGTWMQSTAQGYLIFELTHSPAYLGYIGFFGGLPSWIFMLYGGVVADRFPRRNLLMITQIFMMFLAFLLSFLTYKNLIEPWHIIILSFALGIGNAFDAPARQSFILELVDRKAMGNALAMNSAIYNCAAVIGPATAGLCYAYFGPIFCFIINALSFVPLIAALCIMDIPAVLKNSQLKHTSALTLMKEGLHYAATKPIIKLLIIIAGISSILGPGFISIIPAWAVTVLHGDAKTNGILQSARAAGALMAALLVAFTFVPERKKGPFRGKYLLTALFIYPVVLLLFSLSKTLLFSILLLSSVGAALMIVFITCNTIVQNYVPDELRGRVMSIYTLTYFGCMPIGSLLIGGLAEYFGPMVSLRFFSFLALSFALILRYYKPQLRQI